MKKIRENVLKSFLFVCLGLIITTVVFASARAFYPPTPPGKPVASEVTTSGCLLKYEASKNNGGSPITVYTIEKKDISWGWDNWVELGTVAGLEYNVTGMIENSTAIFRVIARNEAGRSQPSKESNEITFGDSLLIVVKHHQAINLE